LVKALDDPPTPLLVDDEPAIRATLADALMDAGYALLESGSGKEAVTELDAGTDISGLITDIRLGAGLSGWDVARHARDLRPRIAVVYMTGDSATDWPSEGVPNSVVVQKPFAVGQIVTAMSTLLNAIALLPPLPAAD